MLFVLWAVVLPTKSATPSNPWGFRSDRPCRRKISPFFPPSPTKFQLGEFVTREFTINGIPPASLHLEAQIAFCPEKVARRSIFPCTKGDRVVFQDPHRRLVFADSEENLIRLRAAMDEGIRQAFQHAQAFVFTLGLTEAWWIKATDLPACAEPDYGNPDSKPLCYFRNLDFASTLYYVEDLLRLIRKFRGPEVPIFISVSPIPLARTFREKDIAAANMESKSILRTVAGQVTESTPETIYFPSYELCVLDPEAFESEDGRHVKKTKVRSIIDLFYQAHVKRR